MEKQSSLISIISAILTATATALCWCCYFTCTKSFCRAEEVCGLLKNKKHSSIWLLLMKKMQFILTAINSNMKIEPQAFKLSLKKKYQNLLNIAKTKERQNKVTRRKTCGGPSEELPLSTVEQILSI